MKGIKRVRKPNGRVFVYYKHPTGQLTRLPDLPENDPAFLRAYATAAEAKPPPRKPKDREGSVGYVSASLRGSDVWKGWAPATKENRRRILDKILTRKDGAVADVLVREIRPHHIAKDLGGCPPNAANNRLKVWRALMKEAKRLGLIENDPSREVDKAKVSGGGFTPWPPELVEKYRNHHAPGTDARLAFELAYWTGARRSDLVLMGRQMIGKDGWLTYTQVKTRSAVTVPLLGALPRWMAPLTGDHEIVRAEIARVEAQMLFIAKTNGSGRSVKAFGQWFRNRCDEAGIPDGFTLHGLRKSRLTILAELGWSEHQIASWGGHASLSEIVHYTRTARRKRVLMGTEQDQNTGNRGDPVSISGEKSNEIKGN